MKEMSGTLWKISQIERTWASKNCQDICRPSLCRQQASLASFQSQNLIYGAKKVEIKEISITIWKINELERTLALRNGRNGRINNKMMKGWSILTYLDFTERSRHPSTTFWSSAGIVVCIPSPWAYLQDCKSWNDRNKHNIMKNQSNWMYLGFTEWLRHSSTSPVPLTGIVYRVAIAWAHL
jgi:hypothetical protein